ncbi:MAG: hypothetical protein GY719_15200 [bacterium]|nr:hypothetical protein [bacterium]
MISWFKKVIYTCQACGVVQRIPLRRVHFFERFHELDGGEAVLIHCPSCGGGLQIPTPYRTHTGQIVEVDPEKPPRNAFIHGVLPGSP